MMSSLSDNVFLQHVHVQRCARLVWREKGFSGDGDVGSCIGPDVLVGVWIGEILELSWHTSLVFTRKSCLKNVRVACVSFWAWSTMPKFFIIHDVNKTKLPISLL